MADSKEQLDLLREVAKHTNVFDQKLSNATKNLDSFGKSINEVKNAQKEFMRELKSGTKEHQTSPLTATRTKSDDVNNALYEFANKMKTNSDNQLDDTLKKSLEMMSRKNPSKDDYATKSDSKKQEELQKGITKAIANGYDVIGASFTDNPYMRRMSEMQNALIDQQKSSKTSTIGSKLESIGKWGGENPITKLIGGIGGMIGSAKNVSSTMGDAGSFLLGGGIGARRADINTEKNRRKNVLESNVVNAKGKQIENLRTLMQSEHLSDEDKANHSSTIERLLAENQASLDKIKSRSEKMSGDMAKSISYKSGKLYKGEMKGLSSEEKGYLHNNLQSNILTSLTGTLHGKEELPPLRAENNVRTFGDVINEKNPSYRNAVSLQSVKGNVSKLRNLTAAINPSNVDANIPPHVAGTQTFGSIMGKVGATKKTLAADPTSWIYPHSIAVPRTITDYVAAIYTTINDPSFRNAAVSGGSSAVGGGGSLLSSLAPALLPEVAEMGVLGFGGSILKGGIGKLLTAGKGIVGKGIGLAGKAFSAGKGIVGGGLETAGNVLSSGKSILGKVGGEGLAEGAAKYGSKLAPGLGVAAGAVFAANRARKGDYTGAALEGVSGLSAGIGDEVLGLGLIPAIGIQAYLAKRDYDANKQSSPSTLKLQSPNISNQVTPDAKMKLQAELNAQAILASQDSSYGRKIADRDSSLMANKTTEGMTR